MNYIQPEYTKKQVIKNVKITFIWAIIILILIVLPAEYNIDILWFWKVTWLNKLSENYQPDTNDIISEEIFEQQKSEIFSQNENWDTLDLNTKTLDRVITIWPKASKEIKYKMNKWDTMYFSWSSPVELYLDQHGEPTTNEGKEFLPYKSVKTGRYTKDTDTLVAEFTWTHWWYWRNLTNQTIEITLNMKWDFEE